MLTEILPNIYHSSCFKQLSCCFSPSKSYLEAAFLYSYLSFVPISDRMVSIRTVISYLASIEPVLINLVYG